LVRKWSFGGRAEPVVVRVIQSWPVLLAGAYRSFPSHGRMTVLQPRAFTPEADVDSREPVLGFVIVGGPLVGAQVRDLRLANELSRRGYPVHVWWAFDRPRKSCLDSSVQEHFLFSWSRYMVPRWPGASDQIGRIAQKILPEKILSMAAQRLPGVMERQLRRVLRVICHGVEQDTGLIRRFATEIEAAGVTHLLPNLEMLAPFVRAARDQVQWRPRYAVTFQGYEVYANDARRIGLEETLYQRLAEVVRASDYRAVAVSQPYAERIQREVGLLPTELSVIPPGVPVDQPLDRAEALRTVQSCFPRYRPEIPLVTYLGRQDSEKGLDLLLYACRLLVDRGLSLQVALCGPTAFGDIYRRACAQIAEHLRIEPLQAGYVSDDLRSALFRCSRTVVYPSIHEEPFGMVPVEAMAQETPVLVPDRGGIAGVVEAEGHVGGLHFRCWDSGALASQLGNLIHSETLHGQLARGARRVATCFSVHNLGQRVLGHLGLPPYFSDFSIQSAKIAANSQSVPRAA
jgi:glycosyltransferase involved in cell wall biosynthesis